MANIITNSPYVLNTVGTVSNLPAKILVASVVYSGGTVAGHRCLLLESAGGRVVADITIAAAGETRQITVNDIYDGLHLTTLSSGVCYVYLK